MNHADKITQKIEHMTIKSTPKMREKILSDTIQAMEQTINASASKSNVGRLIMKSEMTKFAAAMIVIAALAGIYQLTGSIDGAGVAWAEVIKNIGRVNDYTYRQRQIDYSGVKSSGFEFTDEWVTTWFYSAEFGTRMDMCRRGELITQCFTLVKEQQFISISPSRKTYECQDKLLPQTMCVDPCGRIRQIIAQPHTKIGLEIIDGVLAEGIEVDGQKISGWALDDAVSRLWVDVKTQLPVRLESEGKKHGKQMYAILIQDQFQWNVNLTEADFTPNIPEDYVQEKPSEPNPRWNEVVDAYKQQDRQVDFAPLEELGLLYDDQMSSQPTNTLKGMEEINEARDEMIRSWPRYSDLRQSLQDGLDDKLDMESMSVEELVTLGILLREKFWDAGGTYSSVSCRYAYMARVLLELAYAQSPNDLMVGDELAEAIMAAGAMGASKADGFAETLMELRSSQFQQIREEVESGRQPDWDDFARGCDLVYLASVRRTEEAVMTLDWLIRYADDGGWVSCMESLKWMQPHVAQGEGVGFGIYYPIWPGYPEEFSFGGRTPSFKGPRSRIVIPIPEIKEL